MANEHEVIVGVTAETKSVDTPLQSKPSAIDLLETALFIRGKGYNVLPIYGKKPTIDKWEHLKNSHQSLDEIEGYNWEWATGVAVIFGVNDIHALDADGVRDEALVSDLLQKLGLPPDYEWVYKTGNGFQIYFLCTDDIGKSKDDALSVDDRCVHIELRWKKCYSVVPPSAHYDQIEKKFDGKTYAWMKGFPHGNPAPLTLNVVMDAWKSFTKEKIDAPSVTPAEPSASGSNSPEIEEAIQKFDMRRFLQAQRIPFREENDAQHELRIEYEKGHNSLLWNDEKHCSNWMREGKGEDSLKHFLSLYTAIMTFPG